MAEALRYDLLVQQALRGMVRELLIDAGRRGLPGDHHFFITFDTQADGVRISDRLREQYPEEMTVVLQYQFRELKVTERAFEVVLSFGGVPERLVVPLASIKGFADPSVQFALQFEALQLPSDNDEAGLETGAEPRRAPARPPAARPADIAKSPGEAVAKEATAKTEDKTPQPPDDKAGAEVVRLDRFRKK